MVPPPPVGGVRKAPARSLIVKVVCGKAPGQALADASDLRIPKQSFRIKRSVSMTLSEAFAFKAPPVG